MMWELLIIGVITAFNIIVVLIKYRAGRTADATLDLTILGILAVIFGTGFNTLVIGTTASAIVSAYLWFNPVKLVS